MTDTDKLLDAICVVLSGWVGHAQINNDKQYLAAREIIFSRAEDVSARQKEDLVLAQAEQIRAKRNGAKNGGLARLEERT